MTILPLNTPIQEPPEAEPRRIRTVPMAGTRYLLNRRCPHCHSEWLGEPPNHLSHAPRMLDVKQILWWVFFGGLGGFMLTSVWFR